MSGQEVEPFVRNYDYHPFRQWFWKVAWFSEDYTLEELAEVWFEIDQIMRAKSTEGNYYIRYYNEQTEDMEYADPAESDA